MSRVPYFAFYPADFMNGVRGLTAQEVGVYTMLLCRIYEENGPVEYHVRRLATYCGMREATFAAVVEKLVDLDKLQLVDGMLSNRRAESEISKRADGLKIASKAGKASAEKRQQNQGQDATGVERPFNHTDTDTDTDYSDTNVSGGDAAEAPAGEEIEGLDLGGDEPPKQDEPDPEDELAKELFERGVRYLTRHGIAEPNARRVIGLWRKNHSDSDILSAFMACAKSGAVDPIPWITARLIPPQTFKFDTSKYEAML